MTPLLNICLNVKNEPCFFRLLARVLETRGPDDRVFINSDQSHLWFMKVVAKFVQAYPRIEIVRHSLVDFSEHKNHLLAMLPDGEWCLWLDADEWVSAGFIAATRALCADSLLGTRYSRKNSIDQGSLDTPIPNYTDWEPVSSGDPDYQCRCFLNAAGVGWTGKLHEGVAGVADWRQVCGPDLCIIHHKSTRDLSRMAKWYRPELSNVTRTRGIDGWCPSDLVLNHLLHLTPERDAVLVEVGCWYGASTVFLASEMSRRPGSRMIAVDHFRGCGDSMPMLEQFNGYAGGEFLSNLDDAGLLPFVGVLPFDSLSAAQIVQDVSVDSVWLDASHDGMSVRADIQAWKKKVKAGGLLGGHDYSTAAPELCAVVAEECPGFWTVGDGWFYRVPA